jgi:hypothetical protein
MFGHGFESRHLHLTGQLHKIVELSFFVSAQTRSNLYFRKRLFFMANIAFKS